MRTGDTLLAHVHMHAGCVAVNIHVPLLLVAKN